MKAKQKEILADGDQWWPVGTPLGVTLLAGGEDALRWLVLPGSPSVKDFEAEKGRQGRPGSVAKAEEQLHSYFAGDLLHSDLPLDPRGTEWQLKVWRAMEDIPYGETVSYGAVASAAGKPRAARAVGGAANVNPLPIIVPCHRVVGSDGGLVGFGGGLDLKAALIAHERKVLGRRRTVR
jgi:methylated-DNA-[protein]-cysteine S-methyltransferase